MVKPTPPRNATFAISCGAPLGRPGPRRGDKAGPSRRPAPCSTAPTNLPSTGAHGDTEAPGHPEPAGPGTRNAPSGHPECAVAGTGNAPSRPPGYDGGPLGQLTDEP